MQRRALVIGLVLLVPLGVCAQEEQEPEAQSTPGDEEARLVFEAGSVAFSDARYEQALELFQRAYELSDRAVLLYNVGVAADRLRRDDVALEAFQRFLALVPEHPRRRDVEVRVTVLLGARESGGDVSPDTAASGPDPLHIAGPAVLGALGLAGVVTGIVGIAAPAGCVRMDAAGCVQEEQTNWLGVGIWGGLGVAALTAAVVWLIVGLGDEGGESAVMVRDGAIAFCLDGPCANQR